MVKIFRIEHSNSNALERNFRQLLIQFLNAQLCCRLYRSSVEK